MKNLCLTFVFSFTLLLCGSVKQASAQEAQPIDTLMLMNKVQLTQLYLFEVNRVIKKMPVAAFQQGMDDIPTSKYLTKKFSAVQNRVEKYNETLLLEYQEVIPYADKKNIVDAILYLRKL